MKLDVEVVSGWPRLGWVAEIRPGADSIDVRVGPDVEHGADHVVEAVWDGPYRELSFDRTDLVFGSGLRVRGNEVVFVTSGATVDRLWTIEQDGRILVANSLPLLLARSGSRLSDTYPRYREDIESVCRGLGAYVQELPSAGSPLGVVYFDNLAWDGSSLRRRRKKVGPKWEDYVGYRAYLRAAADRVGNNARDACRSTPVSPVATVSTGYDSPASAVIAREAGAREAHTITRSRSALPRSDDGSRVAAALGLDCRAYAGDRDRRHSERLFIAALGWAMDINMSLFEFSHPLTLLFTGFHGDKFWDPAHGVPNAEIVRGDPSGLGMAEYRLVAGIMHCPVPFWGVRHAGRMVRISRSPEMSAWSVGGDYDRPVPRRIAEDAGVPRRAFGQRKKATTVDWHYRWPETESCETAFRNWLAERKTRVPSRARINFGQIVESQLYGRLRSVLNSTRPVWSPPEGTKYLFAWANNCLADEF